MGGEPILRAWQFGPISGLVARRETQNALNFGARPSVVRLVFQTLPMSVRPKNADYWVRKIESRAGARRANLQTQSRQCVAAASLACIKVQNSQISWTRCDSLCET
jgi:hypothetical protein